MSKAIFFNIRGRSLTLDLPIDRLTMSGYNRDENGAISLTPIKVKVIIINMVMIIIILQ